MKDKHCLKIVNYNSDEYHLVVALRNKILRNPLGLVLRNSDLSNDKSETIIGLFLQNKCIGCVQIRHTNTNEAKLRQMAVDGNFQRQGLGKMIIRFAEQEISKNNYEIIGLHARKIALPFYQKQGYNIVGKEFIEIGIPHYKMIKVL